jgi:glycosyltransferase involved in cell wall biosynthesis
MPADLDLEIHVWGVARTADEQAYKAAMLARATGNPRVRFHDETSHRAEMYQQLDVLVVPSEWLETGPLVVLEAQAVGLPVVGSDIGGIAERVSDGHDGMLVPAGQPEALARALAFLAADRTRVDALRPKQPPRTIADAARETLRTYEALAAARVA